MRAAELGPGDEDAYFLILLCITADNFTCQGESTGAQKVKLIDLPMYLVNHSVVLHPNTSYFIILLCLTADNFTRQGENVGAQRFKETKL